MYLRVRGEGGTLFPKDRCAIADDGTHIAYGVRGRGRATVVLCAGYCCADNFWRYLAPALERHARVLIWNYRGTGVSGLPREPGYRGRRLGIDDFSISRHALDLAAILEHEGVDDDVVLLGHSMGVQVCLEAYRVLRDRTRGIVSITGPYASPIRTFYDSTLPLKIFPLAKLAIRAVPPPALLAWRALFRRTRIPHRAAQVAGALAPDCPYEDMRPYYEHMAQLDPLVMLKMAEAMQNHSAEDVLPQIACPALVMVGEMDRFTPPWLGRIMVSRIPDAELVSIPGGTHAAIIEKPKEVNRAVVGFVRRIGERDRAHPARARRHRVSRGPSRPTA